MTFEQWLETDLGKEVWRRIRHNYHRFDMRHWAATFEEDDDVQQKALIYLWEQWDKTNEFQHLKDIATCDSHLAGMMVAEAIRRTRCKWVRRFWDGVEIEQPQWDDEVYEDRITASDPNSPATVPHPHDKGGIEATDHRIDITTATEKVLLQMHTLEQSLPRKYNAVPLEHIAAVIIEGHLYHYQDRYSHGGNTGHLRAFCKSKGVTKNHLTHWRPIIFETLRKELTDYR